MTVLQETMDTLEMVCIVCPVGCRLKAQRVGDSVKVLGNTCARGQKYAIEELTNPTRMVTTSVAVRGGHMSLLSVKTRKPVPKGAIQEILKRLKGMQVTSPVSVGDVVLADAAGTGVDVVATRSIRAK